MVKEKSMPALLTEGFVARILALGESPNVLDLVSLLIEEIDLLAYEEKNTYLFFRDKYTWRLFSEQDSWDIMDEISSCMSDSHQNYAESKKHIGCSLGYYSMCLSSIASRLLRKDPICLEAMKDLQILIFGIKGEELLEEEELPLESTSSLEEDVEMLEV